MTYVLFSLPLALLVIWFIIDTFKFIQVHQVVYDAAQAAATSAATQASYSVTTSLGGSGFSDGVNNGQATTVANTTFQEESQALHLASVVSVTNTAVGYPATGQASYSATVSYVPHGLFAAIDVLNTLFNSGKFPPTPPTLTWTETAVANHNQA